MVRSFPRLLSDSVISLLFPQACLVCGVSVESIRDGVACDQCWREMRIFTYDDPLCSKCGTLLESVGHDRCGLCDEQHFDSAFSLGAYEGALAKTIINLKSNDYIPERLVDSVMSYLSSVPVDLADLVLPIPLSKERRLERGFNQAETIAHLVGRSLSVPIDSHSLVRTAHSQMHRAGMDRKAREMSVKRSFSVVRPNMIKGRNILLVDDILTSGSTASHCARVLKKAGASRVTVFTIARAVLKT